MKQTISSRGNRFRSCAIPSSFGRPQGVTVAIDYSKMSKTKTKKKHEKSHSMFKSIETAYDTISKTIGDGSTVREDKPR